MWIELFQTAAIFGKFCVFDRVLTNATRLDGIYYLFHFIHNCIIISLTYEDVFSILMNFNYIHTSETNIEALQYVFALHFYHIALYWNKFRYDDWLHHILMIGVALPIGTLYDSRALLGYNLFFTTGLPGGIDYLLLFLNRNGWLNKNREKQINAWLNTWIRSPGCISHAILTLVWLSIKSITGLDWWLGFVVAALTYWNGQYFMRQVVENNAITQNIN